MPLGCPIQTARYFISREEGGCARRTRCGGQYAACAQRSHANYSRNKVTLISLLLSRVSALPRARGAPVSGPGRSALSRQTSHPRCETGPRTTHRARGGRHFHNAVWEIT
ncbi:hypothetical protein AAFF_G00304730 [Aldrovandia affinis]|uniref:Uncharacterized protein n=1 Tax=Aldrovandia affinis TaxID=143900 RepID=A0AAD7WR66_9TELE|nr:hypothetical protein AAFF_G00304730 [Aldrovandia affinis]